MVTQDPDLAERVDGLLAHFEPTLRPARADDIVQVTGSPGEEHTVYLGCYRRAWGDAESLLPSLIGVVNRQAVAGLTRFAVHAAVVALGERVVAFPAASGGGKTTLAAAALRSGASYLSDEALVLDDLGRALPYPKPMALTPWSCERLGIESGGEETLVLPEAFAAETLRSPAPLTDVVLAEYGHHESSIEPLPRSKALSSMISMSFNHYKDPEHAFRLASEVARRVDVWSLRYHDPLEAAALVADQLT